ncbi:MAG TPA: hypothetical protein VFX98_18510 [Longimicrobiaceae bacterium]|nr:hypothetical protein [Longimicrobiaceae bacterium]
MQQHSGDRISATITGNTSGQVAIGTDIRQEWNAAAGPVTPAELAALRAELEGLRARVAAAPDVGEEERAKAQEKVRELEEAVTAPEPDLSTMEYVRNWFAKHLPTLAGAVTSVVVNPIVGKLVATAGDALSAEFQRRFGSKPG